jgi:hypothetical protein
VQNWSHILCIEVGRYNKTPRNERFCKKCHTDEIEDEMQFLLLCNPFETDRKNILDLVVGEVNSILNLWAEIRNLHIDLLYSKFLVYERYLSKPKFCFNLK